jgi:hypothetical protein
MENLTAPAEIEFIFDVRLFSSRAAVPKDKRKGITKDS